MKAKSLEQPYELEHVPNSATATNQFDVTVIVPDVTLKYDTCGGVDVLVGDFVICHINYHRCYNDNASRTRLANEIVKLLRTTP